MISISENDSRIIEFLLKNYSKRYTVREAAIQLKVSPAGAHKSLKKLEEDDITKSEKLGSGLFYEINLENRTAKHLAAFILSQTNKRYDVEKLKEFSKALILHDKKCLVVSDAHDESHVMNLISKALGDVAVTLQKEDEFLENMRKKQREVVEALSKGTILLGEEFILEMIKKAR